MRPAPPATPHIAALFALALAAMPAGSAMARPVEFPPLPNGVIEVREEADVAPYLAAWKANALSRVRDVAQPMTANQQQYDVTWYDLALTFTPSTTSVAGTVRMQATVVGGPLTAVELDMGTGLIEDAATSAGLPTATSRSGAILTVQLDRAYATGEQLDVPRRAEAADERLGALAARGARDGAEV